MKNYKFYLILAITILFIQSGSVNAQVQDQFQDRMPGITGTGVANFYFARPGDFTILVSVWGGARSGRYEVPIGTDVGQLLSLAGGPGMDVRGFEGPTAGGRVRDRGTKTTVRLSRLQGEGREIIMELRIEDLLRLKEETIPLQDGDIIMVDSYRAFNIWDAFGVMGTAASIILLVDRFFTIF